MISFNRLMEMGKRAALAEEVILPASKFRELLWEIIRLRKRLKGTANGISKSNRRGSK